jgi:hypothetical protein
MKRFVSRLMLVLPVLVFLKPLYADIVIDEPKGCLVKEQFPCSLTSLGGPMSIRTKELYLNIGAETVFRFESPSRIRLLSGFIYVDSDRSMDVIFGPSISVKASGIFLVGFEKVDQVRIFNIDSKLEFPEKGFFVHESLPIGFSNWYSNLSTKGQVSRGIIAPIEGVRFREVWKRVSSHSLVENKKLLSKWEQLWQPAVEQAAQFYQEVIERRVASEQEVLHREQLIQEKKAKEQQFFRRMYRQKLGLESENND